MDAGAQLGLDALDPAFAPRPLLRVTPARLATWADCPRRYRLVYVDRPAPPRGGARAAGTLGAVVHLAMRSLFALAPERRTPDAAAALVDRHWTGEGFRDAAQATAYRAAARGWVADYAADLARDGVAEPVATERWVSAPTGGIVAEGRVDRIDERDGELVIVDYKTGRRVPGPGEARHSAALALYAVAAARTLRRPCHRVELHHLPSGEVAAWDHDPGSLSAHLVRAEERAVAAADATAALAAGGDAAELFPPRPAPRCGTCQVRRHCAEGRAAAAEEPSWSGLAELPGVAVDRAGGGAATGVGADPRPGTVP